MTCNDCNTNFKKKIEHDTYDLLSGLKEITQIEEKEDFNTNTEEQKDDEKKDRRNEEDEKYLAKQRQAELYEKAREQHVICPVCGLKIIGEFKGYCPGCGTKFEAV
jgi:rubrerythrin